MMSRPCWSRWRWLCKPASPPRPISSTCCTGSLMAQPPWSRRSRRLRPWCWRRSPRPTSPAMTVSARGREAVMRHDPAAAAITIMLRSLKMHGMAQAAAELTEQGAPAFQTAIPILSQLLKAEIAEREVRSIAYQLKAARFPTYKDLAGFDFASSQLNEALVRQLHAGAFM